MGDIPDKTEHTEEVSNDGLNGSSTSTVSASTETFLQKGISQTQRLLETSWESIEPEHKCTECEEMFLTDIGLKIHTKVHKEAAKKAGYICPECGHKCNGHHAFKNHKLIHQSEKNYVCDVCDRSFKNEVNLSAHRRYKHEQPDIGARTCPVCNKFFSSQTNMRRHLKSHDERNNATFTCGVCYRSFLEKFMLTTHMRSHTGIYPYVCQVCKKGFDVPSLLRKHELGAHGIDPVDDTD